MHRHMSVEVRDISGIWSLPSTALRQAGSLLFLLLHAALSTQAAGPELLDNPLVSTSCLASQVLGLQIPTVPLGVRLFSLLLNRVSLCSPSWPETHTYTTEMGLASASHKSWRSNSNRETCVYSYPFYQMSHLSSCFKVLVLIILVISLKIILIILL